MPRRGASHQTDDQAVTAVTKVLAQAGAAAEVIHKDYGEDLLVQVNLDDEVQPARLWLQVKGTQDARTARRRDGSRAVSVTSDHLLRWARSADPVVLVLWDVTRDQGWWLWIHDHVDEFALYMDGHKTKTLRLPADQPFDAEAVRKLSWRSIIDRYNHAIIQAQSEEAFAFEMAQPGISPSTTRSAVLVFDFLRLIGVIDEDGISNQARTRLQNAYMNFGDDPELVADDEFRRANATSLMVLVAIDERAPGVGVPGTLIDPVSFRLQKMLADFSWTREADPL